MHKGRKQSSQRQTYRPDLSHILSSCSTCCQNKEHLSCRLLRRREVATVVSFELLGEATSLPVFPRLHVASSSTIVPSGQVGLDGDPYGLCKTGTQF
jgi:hypothetical protein